MPVSHGILTPRALIRLRKKVAKAEAEQVLVALPADAVGALIDDLTTIRQRVGEVLYEVKITTPGIEKMISHLRDTCTLPQVALALEASVAPRSQSALEPTPATIDPGDSEGGAP